MADGILGVDVEMNSSCSLSVKWPVGVLLNLENK